MDTFGKWQGFPHPAHRVLNLIKAGKRGSGACQRHASFPNHFRAGITGFDQFLHGATLAHSVPRGEVDFKGGNGFPDPAVEPALKIPIFCDNSADGRHKNCRGDWGS